MVRNVNHLKSFFGITKCIILLNLFNTIFVNNRIHLIEYNITLKNKGTGTKYIFSSNSKFPNESYPDEVYINGDKQNNVSYSYNFNQIDNNVGLVWYNLISNCDNMFRGCSSITEIDFSNFNTSNVDNMESFFFGCSKLISLNLSNFDTSKVTKMNGMFYECSLLTSLNLSNFDTSKVEIIDHMFFGCTNLEYINMINFNEINISNDSLKYRDIFYNVPENIVVYITKANILNKIYPQINNKSCLIEDCEEDWRLKQRKLDLETTELFINGSGIKYENDGQCYSICFYGYINHYGNNIVVKCKCELEKCLTCPRVAFNNKLCSQCNENYYPMENDPLNLGEYINCYNEIPEGYYLDSKIYKKCYNTCETCEINGDNEFHNCLKCNTEYKSIINKNNYRNCYQNCSFYYYVGNNNNYYCTEDFSCPPEYPNLIQDKNECVCSKVLKLSKIL